jgi:hypothetical protein
MGRERNDGWRGVGVKARKPVLGFLLKVFLGFLLVWLGLSATFVVGQAFSRLPWRATEFLVFGGCFIAYFLVHFLLYKPILSHVMAHELTHALAAILMGGKVTSIHASTTGGTTVVNKSHVFISLAPYVFPFYTAVVLGLYLIAAQPFKIYLVGFIGFTYAFHLALTIYSLSHHQPDLKEGGVVFSLIFIFTGNMIVLMLLLSLIWPQVLSMPQVFSETLQWAWRLAQSVFHLLKPHFFPAEGQPS